MVPCRPGGNERECPHAGSTVDVAFCSLASLLKSYPQHEEQVAEMDAENSTNWTIVARFYSATEQLPINIQLDGIEIYFDEKPTDDVLQRLRGNRWRWHRGKCCWYSRISEESLQFANELCKPTHAPKLTKSTVAEQTPPDNSAHITYRTISDGVTLAHVTISKNGDQYTVSSTNNVTFKLCSSYPYKAEFCDTLRRIQQLTPLPNQ